VVKRRARGSAWLCLGLLVTACAMRRAQEFQPAVDHRSQAEVLARWEPPHAVVAGAEGETLWISTVRAHIWAPPAGILVTSPAG
jgi:hypothetical protein